MILGENLKIFDDFRISMGSNVKLKIGDNTELSGEIRLSAKNNVEIGDNTKIDCSEITMQDSSTLKIGDNCWYKSVYFVVCDNAILNIGSYNTTMSNISFILPENTEINIGNDCMFSSNIILRSNDGHAIFDVKTKKNINSTKKISKQRKIIIGDHVWIGAYASILYNTQIGSGSIIGEKSLVKSIIPNNCIAAGVPARIIRKDVAWSREFSSENISDCGEGYINFTED